ncbi:hypothetical protein [Actinomycetospora sp. CA-084318]|uniref:hypothetical protein n=1 Tax=Actinomycetospora sp. CA-084318 TaxID=3239892 RepID=UPI003D97960F
MEITDGAIEVALRWYFEERGRSDWGLSEDQWRTITRQMRDVLEAAAPRPEGLLFYRGLVEQTDLRDHPAWNLLVAEFLLLLVKACVDSGLPLLTALVYGKASNEPGPGFYDAARHFGLLSPSRSDDEFWFSQIAEVRVRWRQGTSLGLRRP